MNILESYLNILNEGYLISDKTISIDLDKFISGKSNTLLIVGLSGSGKTTLGYKISKEMNVEYTSTDGCPFDWAKYSKGDMYVQAEMLNKYMDCCEVMSNAKGRSVLEGVGLIETYWERPKSRSSILKHPCIILGASALKSSLRATERSKASSFDLHFYKSNFKLFQKMLSKFRKDRLSVKGSIVKEYND